MILSEYIKIALASIRAARFRSFLTMLGIIIGVLSVITVASLGEGIKRQLAGPNKQIRSDLITVRPGKLVNRDTAGRATSINLLSFLSSSSISSKDLETVSQNQAVELAVPFSLITGAPALEGRQMNEAFIMATNDQAAKVIGKETEFGNFFDAQDANRRVAVIGQGVAEKLFKENVPIGKTMQVRGQDFVVRGVLPHFKESPINPDVNFNNGVFIPYQTGKDLLGEDLKVYQLFVLPKNQADTDKIIGQLNSQLKQNHAGQEDFTVLRQDDVVEVTKNLLQVITNTVTIMALITLFVGGIGIMNVMLVSITERTREIGIRKAVGATNRQIYTQFMVEAVVLSVWGAVIGIFFAVIVNILLLIGTNFQPVITWQMLVLSAIISIVVGVVFGTIPAVKAARKDPIESLRAQ